MMSYCNGNAVAFDVLYSRHKAPVYRYMLRQCGKEYADELFQELWIKLVNARDKYQVQSSFKTWLYTLAHNHIVDHFRRINVRPVGHSESLQDDPIDTRHTPEQLAQLNEQQQRLIQSINNLPADQRDTLLLQQEAGLSYEQIAEATGVNTETVKSRLRYAIQKIKADLNLS